MEYAETTDLKSAGKQMKRNKNEHKLTEKIIKSFKFRLVRMRSAVRIRPAAPENPRNHAISGIFLTFFGRNGVGQNVGQPPDPHRDPHVEMCGKV